MRREAVGFLYLGSVVVIWVLSGFFIQATFTSPVTMTVLSVGLCSVLLLLPNREEQSVKQTLLVGKPRRTIMSTQMVGLGITWLAAQTFYNVSLQYMSVSANTAVSCSSSLFTFLFSVVFLKGYSFTLTAVSALACSCGGILLISIAESSASTIHSRLPGFGMALASCMCYGLFTTLLKKFSLDPNFPKSVATMFGCFGVVALIAGVPLIFICDMAGIDQFTFPTSAIAIAGIILNALVGSVLSDVLLAKAVLLLNPLTVSIGLSMSMPLSVLLDSVEVRSACVAAIVMQLAAVCLISYDNHRQHRL